MPGSEGWALDVAVSGDYAYVAQNAAGLHVFDVSDPAHPAHVGALTCPRGITNVVVAGHYAYAAWRAESGGGLYIIDVTDPASPVLAGTYASAGECNGVAVANGYAYLAESSGLRILDISDPSTPVLVGTYITSDTPWRIVVEGNLAYLVVQGFEAECGRQLQIIDVTSPAEPIKIGSCCLPDSYDADWGGYLYMFCYEIAVQSGFAYVAWADGETGGYFEGRLDTIDVSDPAHPVRCSAYETAPGVRGMAMDGGNVYLCVKQENLVALDMREPCTPSFLGVAETWGAMNACALDGYVYLANGPYEELMIFGVDSDRDLLADREEINTTLTDPYDPDTDGDHLSDGDEVINHFTDPLERDTDGDGVNDGEEVTWGSDPLDPEDTVELPLSGWGATVAALGLAGIALLGRRVARA